jgi:hypothetical protein
MCLIIRDRAVMLADISIMDVFPWKKVSDYSHTNYNGNA